MTGTNAPQANTACLQDYMKEQHLPSTLKHRVLDFFEYLWVRNKGTDRRNLLSDLPYCMQAEVSLATTEDLLKKVITCPNVLQQGPKPLLKFVMYFSIASNKMNYQDKFELQILSLNG